MLPARSASSLCCRRPRGISFPLPAACRESTILRAPAEFQAADEATLCVSIPECPSVQYNRKNMLDIHFIRENADIVKAGAAKKRIDADIDRLLAVDDERKELKLEIETKR